MIIPTYSEMNNYYIRWVWDLAVFIVINITFVNFFLVTIIDKFVELRNRKATRDADMANICQICSLDRRSFLRVPGGFQQHITQEHNSWSYLFYIYGLGKKDSTEYDGLESYVSDQLKRDQTDWVPQMRAMSLADFNSEEDILANKLDEILAELRGLSLTLNSE